MSGILKSSGDASSSTDRRVYPREQIPFTRNLYYIDLGHGQAGTVLNLSERGFAVKAIANSIEDWLPQIRLKFSQSDIWVETSGRIVWANESRDLAGVEFIGLSGEGRVQIRKWLGEIQAPRLTAIAEEEAIQSLHAADSDDPLARPTSYNVNDREMLPSRLGAFAQPVRATAGSGFGFGIERGRSARRSSSMIVFFIVLSTIGFFFLFLSRHVQNTRQKLPGETTTKETQIPISTPASSEPPATATLVPEAAGFPKETSGFVLQAAAMAQEENAIALAESLRQRKFPVFVFKSNSGRFYKVFIGPYRDQYSATTIDHELLRQGFQTFLRRWSPTQ